MSAITSGSFTPSAATADLAKEVGSNVAVIPAGGNVAQTVNPAVPMQGFVAYNMSSQYVRGTIALSAGITAVGAAATRVFVLPPNSSYALDLGNDNDDLGGIIEAIDSITYQAVTIAATAEASTLAAAPALAANAVIITNFAAR